MRVYGVPKEGKRVKFSDGLSLVLPFGTAYAKDDDGKYNILYYKTTPAGYRNGVFTADDEEEVLWSINGLQKNAVVNFESDEAELTPASVREEMPAQLRGVAQTLVGEDNSSKEPYEPGSSTKVEETEGGFVIRSGITVNAAGGSYQLLDLGEKAVGAVVKKGVQIFGLTMYFTYLLLAVEDCPEAPLFSATLRAPDDPDFYEKTLVPLLKTAWLESTGKSDKRAKSKIQRNAAPVVASLDFSEGERVRTGEFSILVPGGMCWSGEIAPETRYLTSIPASVTFDNPDWDDASAIRFTVQTGQKIPAIQAALDTPEGEGQVQALLRSMNISQQGTADSSVGSVTTVARGPDYYICYSLGKETGIDYLYRYFLFSRTFVYTGMYIGWKAGLKDALEQHTKILEQWLGTVRYEGDAGAELARYGRTQFGKYAAEDGKLNAVLIAQLFSTDVLFFNEDDFKENGLKNGVHINSLKLSEHPLLAEKRDVLAPEIANLLLELDAVPELRVSKEKIHKKLLPLLFNDHAVPLTGMTVMNLLAYHMLHIQENGPDGYTAIIDRNLVAGIPDAYRYAAEFLRQLRLYNGKSGAFTVTFANAMNFDTPIQGALRPVDGAAQPKSGCRIRVEENGSKQELEAAEEGEQPAAEGQRPVQELEQDLPPEFASRMRKFSADISSRLAQVCETLEASDYSDLTNTDDVLSRVMDQAGDYGLAWGIFNFYNVFTLGDRDSTFSFERAGEKDFSDPDGPAYRIDEQYEEYAEGDLDFQPDAFPKQLAERLRGITEDEIYQALLEQAVEAQRKGYTIVDEERKRIEKQKKELEKVPFDPVSPVKLTGSAFVLTGEFEHMDNDRDAIKAKIQAKGGRCTQSISGKTDYLVIGGLGGFGDRKLDQVREQRAKGSTIKIIRERTCSPPWRAGRQPQGLRRRRRPPPEPRRFQRSRGIWAGEGRLDSGPTTIAPARPWKRPRRWPTSEGPQRLLKHWGDTGTAANGRPSAWSAPRSWNRSGRRKKPKRRPARRLNSGPITTAPARLWKKPGPPPLSERLQRLLKHWGAIRTAVNGGPSAWSRPGSWKRSRSGERPRRKRAWNGSRRRKRRRRGPASRNWMPGGKSCCGRSPLLHFWPLRRSPPCWESNAIWTTPPTGSWRRTSTRAPSSTAGMRRSRIPLISSGMTAPRR